MECLWSGVGGETEKNDEREAVRDEKRKWRWKGL